MKLLASGEAQLYPQGGGITKLELSRVVGIVDIGDNNAYNDFGWSGRKPIVSIDGQLYVLDFIQEYQILTFDDFYVTEGDHELPLDQHLIDKFDLYHYSYLDENNRQVSPYGMKES